MEVKIVKEIRDYQESVFFGLSARQFFCVLLALGVAVGIYFGLKPLVGSEENGWDLHFRGRAVRGLRLFPIPWDDCRAICLDMDKVKFSLSPKADVQV